MLVESYNQQCNIDKTKLKLFCMRLRNKCAIVCEGNDNPSNGE